MTLNNLQSYRYIDGQLHWDGVSLDEVAEKFGTPCHVYSASQLDANCRSLLSAFKAHPTTACFAVKANSNLSLLRRLFSHGFGADVVSLGELERSLYAGADPGKIVFSGVGKTAQEITRALTVGIRALHVESASELWMIRDIARALRKRAAISLRINPDIDAHTLPQITTGREENKFGIPEKEALSLFTEIRNENALCLVGIGCHIGSQITELAPFEMAATRMAQLAGQAVSMGFPLLWIDLGGGRAIRYQDEEIPSWEDYARTLLRPIIPAGLELVLEPGRSIIGDAGVLICQVIRRKENGKKTFLVVDAAMNDLIRPSLYGAYHHIRAIKESADTEIVDVVGPVCETSDCFGENRRLPSLNAGELIVIESTGAYGSSMASRYNSRPDAAEVLLDSGKATLIRRRPSLKELWSLEEAPLNS